MILLDFTPAIETVTEHRVMNKGTFDPTALNPCLYLNHTALDHETCGLAGVDESNGPGIPVRERPDGSPWGFVFDFE
jgi:hypothetical protein